MEGMGLFILRFIYVSASAFQQKSVIGDKWATIPITCYIRAGCDYGSWGLVAYAVTSDTTISGMILNILLMGTGATAGVYIGMKIHNRVYKNGKTAN